MGHIMRVDEMAGSNYDWNAIIANPELVVTDATPIKHITQQLARDCANSYNTLNLPSPDDVSAIIAFLDRNFGTTDENEISHFMASMYWCLDLYHARTDKAKYMKIWRDYIKSHPDTKLEFYRKLFGN